MIDCVSAGVLVADHLCTPISHLPQPGELVLAEDLPLAIGGCAANASIDLARLGARVEVVGCVGQDAFGRYIAETLESAGVGAVGLRHIAERPTSGTLIINVAGQDRRFIHCQGANAALRVEDIDFELVRQAKVFYLGGYLLMPALEAKGLAALFARARAAGVTTVLDVVLPGPGDHWAQLEPVLRETDVFLPNSDEARIITGEQDPVRQAERFRAAGARVAVITCGGDGTVLLGEGLRLRAGAFEMPFVGGTGAGDAFDAGYIAGLLRDESPRRCLEWGAALGASCVRAVGATEAVFNRAEAEAYLRDHQLRIEEF
ncbi:MAG: carbohydrate kinase family protein [Pirellulales bacterium]|nr:carbohydrate kinase family protein [Pirellulales bacterium]